MAKLVSCSKCFKPVETKKTAVIEGLRVCHDCRKAASKLPFNFAATKEDAKQSEILRFRPIEVEDYVKPPYMDLDD